MTTTITKGKIGEQDVNHWDGTEDGLTFERDTSTGGTMTLQSVGAVVDVLMSYGGGVNRDRAAIAGALTAIGATNKVGLVLRPGTWDIDDDLTITSNITLIPVPGCKFTVAAGKTATIQGPVVAGAYRWIYGTGTSTISSYPQDQAWSGSTQRTDFTGIRVANVTLVEGANTYAMSAFVKTLMDDANAAAFWATLGVATPPAIGETTPNTIRGLNKEILVPDTASLTAAQCSGTIINNYGMADADAVIDLPAAAAGLAFLVLLGAARSKYYRLKCLDSANDKIYLNGVAGADDGYVEIAAAVVGASISFFTFQTGASAYDWYAIPISGLWVAG